MQQFKVYGMLIWYTCILQNDYHTALATTSITPHNWKQIFKIFISELCRSPNYKGIWWLCHVLRVLQNLVWVTRLSGPGSLILSLIHSTNNYWAPLCARLCVGCWDPEDGDLCLQVAYGSHLLFPAMLRSPYANALPGCHLVPSHVCTVSLHFLTLQQWWAPFYSSKSKSALSLWRFLHLCGKSFNSL